MATTQTCFLIPTPSSGVKTNSIRAVLLGPSQLSWKRPASLQIRSSINNNNQLFEDVSEGIICYKDMSGEIVCEGYDEGPRIQQKRLQPSCDLDRDVAIMNFLQQNWIQIAKGSEVYRGDLGLFVQEDINCNGFNTLH